MLLRMETKSCPGPLDQAKVGELLRKIIQDISMKPLDKAHVYYVSHPEENEGLTAILPIQTSHIAFHFWANPEKAILKSKGSRCLLEFDLYTCGSLNSQQIQKILHHLTGFQPTRADVTVLNRKWSVSIDRHTHWSGVGSWPHWVDAQFS